MPPLTLRVAAPLLPRSNCWEKFVVGFENNTVPPVWLNVLLAVALSAITNQAPPLVPVTLKAPPFTFSVE